MTTNSIVVMKNEEQKNIILKDKGSEFKLLLFSWPLYRVCHRLALWPWASIRPFHTLYLHNAESYSFPLNAQVED